MVHVASYISLPVAPPDYDMAEAIRLRASAHSFEGKVFTVVSCSTISKEIQDAIGASHPQAARRWPVATARFPASSGRTAASSANR